MQRTKATVGTDYATIAHRLDAGFVYRLKDRGRMRRAMAAQDAIRKKVGSGGDSTKEIRKWRERRYAAGS